MTNQTAIALAAAALFTPAGWALAQPGDAFPGRVGPDGPNRYAVSAMGTSAVMVDTMTGRTWVLHQSAGHRPAVWLPAARIDDPEQAVAWYAKQEVFRRDRALKTGDPTGKRVTP